jgi:pimeloyl-ACP methyl ester carboxylesterase
VRADKAGFMMEHGVGEWSRRTIGVRVDPRHADPRLLDWVVAQMGRVPARVGAGLTTAFSKVEIGDRIASISPPTMLIIGGANDWIVDQQAAVVASLPSARLKVFDDYGHGIALLEPAACAEAAVAFWDELEGEPGTRLSESVSVPASQQTTATS